MHPKKIFGTLVTLNIMALFVCLMIYFIRDQYWVETSATVLKLEHNTFSCDGPTECEENECVDLPSCFDLDPSNEENRNVKCCGEEYCAEKSCSKCKRHALKTCTVKHGTCGTLNMDFDYLVDNKKKKKSINEDCATFDEDCLLSYKNLQVGHTYPVWYSSKDSDDVEFAIHVDDNAERRMSSVNTRNKIDDNSMRTLIVMYIIAVTFTLTIIYGIFKYCKVKPVLKSQKLSHIRREMSVKGIPSAPGKSSSGVTPTAPTYNSNLSTGKSTPNSTTGLISPSVITVIHN